MHLHPIIRIFLTCFSGFLLSLSAPGYNFSILAWVGLAPLFIIINTSKKLKKTIFYSLLFGFSYNLCYLHWLFSLHPLTWLGFNNCQSISLSALSVIVVAGYNSFFFVIFAICVTYLKRFSVSPYNKNIPNLTLTTFLWLIIFNKLSSLEFLFGFPWTLIEYSQYKNLFLIQIAEYLGSTSIGFLIVFFNQVIANLLIWFFNIQKIGDRYIPRTPGQFEEVIFGFSFILILISINLIYGVFSYGKSQEHFSNDSLSICILQGNLPIKSTRGESLDINLTKKTYSNLIKNNEASLIIAPEGALPTVFNSEQDIQYWLKSTCTKKQSDIIIGSYCKGREKLTNCAVACEKQVNKFSFYEKERLVPFGEFTPFSFILPRFLKRFAHNIIGEGFSKGIHNEPVDTSVGKIGINICFEIIFPAIIRKHSLQGAKLLVNLSDLSWFSNDYLKQQFLSFAVFRAIENRRPVIIASNNGISAIIDPSGKIKSQSIPNTEGVLADWINLRSNITFYSRYGW